MAAGPGNDSDGKPGCSEAWHTTGTPQVRSRAAANYPLKGWNPASDPTDAKDLPIGKRPQTYRPDNYNCTGAVFAKPGVEFTKFPQPRNYHITNRHATQLVRTCRSGVCTRQAQSVWQPTAAINPLAPFFPPFTHFVIIMRENHTFDDYLGDCATTIAAGCNGVVESTNHISSVPNLHTLAKTYALGDSYSTGTQPPSGPNHWWLFSAQSQSSSQQQSYPTATGTQFDRFLGGDIGPSGEGTNACTAQTGTGSGGSPYTFMAAGDFYWMLSSGSGYWRNPGGSATGGTAPYSYSWAFGDGSTSTAQNPSHTYSSAGTYTATLTVTDSSSPAKTATSSVTVTVSAVGNPLVATAGATPTSGQIPVNVAFTGTATGGTPSYHYSWNFGDGSTSTAQNPSHSYGTAGTYTATLTVTDSSSPAKTASSSVTITASPVAGTAPGAPTGLTASAGNGQVSLSWTPPASNGGVNITSYRVYRGTASGAETLLTSGGCSGLGAVASCTDTGLTNGQAYYYKVTAVNALGEGPQSNEASATPAGSCPAAQLLGNPGFENGSSSPAPWKVTSTHTPLEVVNNNSLEPPHSGNWDAWLDGWGTTTTDTLSQTVTLPTGCSNYNFSFWLHINTAETTTTTAYDKLTVQVVSSSGTVLATLHTYSNLDHNTGYAQRIFSLSGYAGQTITLKFTGSEDYELQTSFVIDDAAVNVS